jgi:hypothetical protein
MADTDPLLALAIGKSTECRPMNGVTARQLRDETDGPYMFVPQCASYRRSGYAPRLPLDRFVSADTTPLTAHCVPFGAPTRAGSGVWLSMPQQHAPATCYTLGSYIVFSHQRPAWQSDFRPSSPHRSRSLWSLLKRRECYSSSARHDHYDQRKARAESATATTSHAVMMSRSTRTALSDAPLLMIWRSASLR